MTNRSHEFWRLINPVTDFPAVLAILLGLGIALFLDQAAIKLIGACVSILGVVALFLLFSQRTKDISMSATKPVSDTTSFKTTVKQDPTTKRLIFDDFAASFGSDELPKQVAGEEDEQTADAENEPTTAASVERSAEIQGAKTAAPPPAERSASIVGAAYRADDADLDDSVEGFRIISTEAKPAAADTKENKKTKKPAKKAPKATPPKSEPARRGASDSAGQPAAEQQAAPEKTTTPATQAAPEPAKAEKSVAAAPQSDEKQEPTSGKNDTRNVAKNAPPAHREAAARQASIDTLTTEETELHEQFGIGHKRKKLNIQLEEIFEEQLDSLRNEPRKEFDYLIKRVLMVIRSVISARTTMFLWVNVDKAEFVIETKISDAADALIDKRKLAFGSDVVSQIAANGAPEILTEINPNAELDLLPYYSSAAGTRSFVGVPVYYNGMVWGVLTADTTEEDAYDTQTVGFLGHFTKLIGGLIQGYGEKYDLLQSARTMESIDGFRKLINDARNTRHDICFALVDKLAPLIPHSILGVCIYEQERRSWVIAELRGRNGAHLNLQGEPVDLQHSLIGKAILAGETHMHADIAPNIVRVSEREAPLDSATYTFVPIKSLSNCFGAIFIETPRSNELTMGDVQIVELLAEYAGSVLEQLNVSNQLQSNALIDESTGIPNFTAFRNRMYSEFVRTRDQKLNLTLCLLSMDQYRTFATRMNTSFAETCMNHVLAMLGREIRPYDVIGRVNDTTIGIGRIDADSRSTELWAERIRNKIASTILEDDDQQFSVTVSVGLVEYAGHENLDAFLEEAESVLNLAAERSNSVVVYS